jgi:5-methylcytosine-specific restriction endonuclease McrA
MYIDHEHDEEGQTMTSHKSALTRPTLVLNKGWQPVRVTTAARGLIMLWNGTVKVVDPESYVQYTWEDWAQLRPRDGQDFIQTVRHPVCIPEVVVLQNYDKIPIQVVTFSRRNLFRRDHFQCQYCGKKPKTSELTIDHVMPRSRGGKSTWDNCVLACIECNTRKGSKTPVEAHMKMAKKPVRPSWTKLFAAPQQQIHSWSKFISEAYWNVELQE